MHAGSALRLATIDNFPQRFAEPIWRSMLRWREQHSPISSVRFPSEATEWTKLLERCEMEQRDALPFVSALPKDSSSILLAGVEIRPRSLYRHEQRRQMIRMTRRKGQRTIDLGYRQMLPIKIPRSRKIFQLAR
jgi:hypothetical protein